MTKNNNKKRIIAGRNIYQDEKGRNIFYNKNTCIGYVIQEKDESQFLLYKSRFLYVAIGVILAVNFIANIYICLLVGAALLALLEYKYRAKFLPSLIQITNFKPYQTSSFVEQIVQKGDKPKSILTSVLYLAFAILLIINGIQMQLSDILMVGNIVIAAGAVYFSGIYFFAALKIKK